eukprot:120760_1
MSTALTLIDNIINEIDTYNTCGKICHSESCHPVNNILYATPMDAFKNGRREKILYTTATRSNTESKDNAEDMIAVVDVDPSSSTYCEIIQQLLVGRNQEIHHSGWNACASCYGMSGFDRKYLVAPAFGSGDIHFIDVSDPKNIKLKHTVSAKMIKEKYGLSYPHTTHCLPNGNVMISFLGRDKDKINGLDFLWINGETFQVEKTWIADKNDRPAIGYDYWYQPYHNIMVSSEWGVPDAFTTGFNLDHVKNNKYGSSLHFWDWEKHKKIKTINFGLDKVCMPLEIKFFHNPKSVHAVCGAALTSNIIHIYRDHKTNEWMANPDWIKTESIQMNNWILPEMPALTTDVIISMDDKYVYVTNWIHGDVCQYDVTDPFCPRLNSQVFFGGHLVKDSGFKAKDQNKYPVRPVTKIKGIKIEGGPQMVQLSLDGKRLYITNSLATWYDKQFYPDLVKNGGQIVLIDIDLDGDTKMKLNKNFIVDFGTCKGGPARPHEMRYPGGDCTSDIFLVQT